MGVQGDHFFLHPGDIPLVFWDGLRLEFPIAVPWHIDLKLAILAFKCLGGMAVPFIVCSKIPLLMLVPSARPLQTSI